MSDRIEQRSETGPVRLTMPVSVAGDLEGLQKTLGELAGRMGCPQCHSGLFPLYLETESAFSLTDRGLVPDPIPWNGTSRVGGRVDVLLSDKVAEDIEMIKRAVAVTMGKLGCAACCSGFDIVFRRESEMMTVTEREVEGLAG